LVDTEWTTRKNNRFKYLICRAGFPISVACVQDIEYRADRKLDREQSIHCSWMPPVPVNLPRLRLGDGCLPPFLFG
jgi:hypothetical protein